MRRLFFPPARQWNVLIAIGFLALGYGLYLRYVVIEQTNVSLACEGGLATFLCATRRTAIVLFQNSVLGTVALVVAALNLVRPSLVLLAIGIAASAFGSVLYNVGLSGLAAALLILSFARPATETA